MLEQTQSVNMNSNYFMNMYSVSPVLSGPNIVPLTTINHSDALSLAIPTVPNMSNNAGVRTVTNASHPASINSHAGHHTHTHMQMATQSSTANRGMVTVHQAQPQQQQQQVTVTAPAQHQPPLHAPSAQQTTTSHQHTAHVHRTVHHRTTNLVCETPFVCGFCNQGFRKPGSLKKHMRVHANQTAQNQFRNANDDDEDAANPYKCNVCKIEYTNATLFENHIQLEHAQPQALKCTQCGCFRPVTLSSLKPFRCESCAERGSGAFETVGMLRYQITKSASAPIAAQQIHIASSNSSSSSGNSLKGIKLEMAALLQQGMYPEFFKKPNKPHKCSECDKSYKHQSTLAMHKKTHSGDFKYRCEVCSKEFYLTEYYNRHMRVHTKEKPYACDICDKSFSQSNTLTQHKRTHTGLNMASIYFFFV